MKRVAYTLLAATSIAVAFGTSNLLTAQPIKHGQAGMSFLQIDVGVSSAAMGGTQLAHTGVVMAVFENPAGLAMLTGAEVEMSINNWIADIKQYGGAAAFRWGNLGTFGASIVWMDYGEIQRTIPYQGSDPTLQNQGYLTDGTFSVSNYAVGISYARQIATQFFVGGHLRYAREDLGDVVIFDELRGEELTAQNELSNIVFDFGTIYYPGFEDLRFGMSVRNFSNQSDYYDHRFELPLTLDFGMAMDIFRLLPSYDSGAASSALTVAFDWLHPRDYSERLHLGLEYAFMDMVFLRGGYKFNYDEQGLTAGLGVKTGFEGMRLNAGYSYSAFGDLFGAVNRVALGIGID